MPMEEFMRVQFVEKANGPERLVGFAVWRGAEGDLYITFPSRAFGTATDRKFFDYLRATEPGAAGSRRVKDWILEEYRTARAA
jgi:hypothetical protein